MQECSGSPSCGWSERKDVNFQKHSDFPQQTYDHKEGYYKIYSTSMENRHIFKAECTSTVVEFLDEIQIFILYFFNCTNKLQFLSKSVILLYKNLCCVFFYASLSLPVHCNAYRSTELSAATIKHD